MQFVFAVLNVKLCLDYCLNFQMVFWSRKPKLHELLPHCSFPNLAWAHNTWALECGQSQLQPLQTAGSQTLGTANFSNYSETRACKIKVWPNCQTYLYLGRLHVVLLISDRDPRRRFDNPWAKMGTKPNPGWLLSSCWAKKAHEPQGWPIFVLYCRKTQHPPYFHPILAYHTLYL